MVGKVKPGHERLREVLPSFDQPEVWIRFPRQLGDVIFSIPFLHGLQQSWNAVAAAQGKTIRWVAVGHAIGAAIFSEAHPDFIAECVNEQGGKGKPDPFSLLRRWREKPPVAVINLSQSVRLALAAWMVRVPIRAGDVNNRLGFLYHHTFEYRDLDLHIVERFRPLLQQLTGTSQLRWMPLSPERLGGHRGPEKLRAAGWDGRPFVTLAFGTRGHNKRWFPEEEKWPALARLFLEQGLAVAWLGGPDETELGRRLAALAPGSFDLTGQTSIPEACALQYGAYGNVAVDTGLAHTAAGSGRPTVTLLGGSPDPLINPFGPYALGFRGPTGETLAREATYETHGNASHRVQPERVVNLLHAMAAEMDGKLLRPQIAHV